MEEECAGLWSAKKIRDRYSYNVKWQSGGISVTSKPKPQKAHWDVVERKISSLVEYMMENCKLKIFQLRLARKWGKKNQMNKL